MKRTSFFQEEDECTRWVSAVFFNLKLSFGLKCSRGVSLAGLLVVIGCIMDEALVAKFSCALKCLELFFFMFIGNCMRLFYLVKEKLKKNLKASCSECYPRPLTRSTQNDCR